LKHFGESSLLDGCQRINGCQNCAAERQALYDRGVKGIGVSLARWLGFAMLLANACFSTLKVDAWRNGKQLAEGRKGFADYKSDTANAATKASEATCSLEQ